MKNKEFIDKLNAQYNCEIDAALLYMHCANQSEKLDMPNLAAFFKKQATEEFEHADKVESLIIGLNETPLVNKAEMQSEFLNFKSTAEVLKQFLDAEVNNTKRLLHLTSFAVNNQFWSGMETLNWLNNEQLEEEDLARRMIDSHRLINNDGIFDNSIAQVRDRDISKVE